MLKNDKGQLTAQSNEKLGLQGELGRYGADGELISGVSLDSIAPYIDQAKEIYGRYIAPDWMTDPPSAQEMQATDVLRNMASALSIINKNPAGRLVVFESCDDRRLDVRLLAGDGSAAEASSQYEIILDDGLAVVSMKQEAYDETGVPLINHFKNEKMCCDRMGNDGTVSVTTYAKLLNHMAERVGLRPAQLEQALESRIALIRGLQNVSKNFYEAAAVLGVSTNATLDHNKL